MEFKTKIIVSVLLFLFSNNISLLKAPVNKSEKVCLKNDTNIVNNKLKLNKYTNEEILILKQRFKLPVNIKNRNQILKYNGFKSYEETKTITFGKAGKLNKLAKTDINGFKTINNRYLVAVGTYFNLELGQYFDIVLENGTVIPCMMGDTKANEDTCDKNIFTVNTKCATEFIVSKRFLPKIVKTSGDVSFLNEKWKSPVSKIIVYENRYEVKDE